MNPTPPDESAAPRRNRSRQRERILEWVQECDSHPTAAEIYEALLPSAPALSLGTVYRNLEVLVATGEVDEVPSTIGATRYDGNRAPHSHFNCERCGRIFDVDIQEPRGLKQRLDREHGFRATRVRVAFFGACPECQAASGSRP